MTPEERQLLGGLFDRIRDAAQGQQRDAEAEAFINNAVRAQPYAPYLMAQAVIVQEETLKGAAEKIEQLEARVRELEAAARAPEQAAPASSGFLGGFGRSIFGGEQPRPAQAAGGSPGALGLGPARSASGVPSTSGISVPPRPGQGLAGQPAGQQPAPWQQPQQQGGGSSFLKGALGAAAGVAGGMLLANALGGLFRGDSAASAATGQKSGENVASSVEKDSPWGAEPKSAGDDWGSSSAHAAGDDWDNSASVSGDDWDDSSGSGDDWGGDD